MEHFYVPPSCHLYLRVKYGETNPCQISKCVIGKNSLKYLADSKQSQQQQEEVLTMTQALKGY